MAIISDKKRISWIDMAKGYGIVFVILEHMGTCSLGTWIRTFHMPLFFFLSGYVFSAKDSFPVFVRKKFKSIIVPFFLLGIPMLLFELVPQMIDGSFSLSSLELVVNYVIQRRIWNMWYLTCLFLLNILFYFLNKRCVSEFRLGVVCVGLTVLGLLYACFVGIALPWNIDVVPIAVLFFFLGYYCKLHPDRIPMKVTSGKSAIIVFIILGIVNVASGYLSLQISGSVLDMSTSTYGFIPLTFLSAFAGIICVIIAAKAFTFQPVKYIGENSLLYYAWHQIIMFPISRRILSTIGLNISASAGLAKTIIYKAAMLIIVILLSTICNMIIKNTKLKFMLGKW